MHVEMIMPGYYDSNVYLINKKILVDTGMSVEPVLSKLEKLVPVSNIQQIILTHGHFDHCGAAAAIIQKSGAKLGICKDDASALLSDKISCSLSFGQRINTMQPDVLYQDGDQIPIGLNEARKEEYLKVISTPGHTVGSICLYEENSASLFSGDTVFSDGGIGRSDFENSACEKMTASIQKLTQLPVQNLYPGHGAPTIKTASRSIQLSYMMSSRMNP
jgi:glyoxylase-like metal-dependent hydrolase (beta-lactamase superfamily II)